MKKQSLAIVLSAAVLAFAGCPYQTLHANQSAASQDAFEAALHGTDVLAKVDVNDIGRITVIHDPKMTGDWQDAYLILRSERVTANDYTGTGIHIVLVGGVYPENKKAPEIANFDLSPQEATGMADAIGRMTTELQQVPPDTPEHSIYWQWEARSHLQVIAGRGDKSQYFISAPAYTPAVSMTTEQMLDVKSKILAALKTN